MTINMMLKKVIMMMMMICDMYKRKAAPCSFNNNLPSQMWMRLHNSIFLHEEVFVVLIEEKIIIIIIRKYECGYTTVTGGSV